jgi:hypothetical protein
VDCSVDGSGLHTAFEPPEDRYCELGVANDIVLISVGDLDQNPDPRICMFLASWIRVRIR